MADWDAILTKVDTHIRTVQVEEETFREDIKKEIEDAKRDEILSELKKITARMDKIETRLPPEEDENQDKPSIRRQ